MENQLTQTVMLQVLLKMTDITLAVIPVVCYLYVSEMNSTKQIQAN